MKEEKLEGWKTCPCLNSRPVNDVQETDSKQIKCRVRHTYQ